jgi:hypothetical protein
VTVDEIEKETGIDFFSSLDDKLENQNEGKINTASGINERINRYFKKMLEN